MNNYSEIFIPKAVGVSEDYPWVDSENDDYVVDVIRDQFLADSTVTLVLVGKCTWSRKFVDWEVYSSLRKDTKNRLNGLLAIELPSVSGTSRLPERVSRNIVRNSAREDEGYARYISYPSSEGTLRSMIEDAFQARTSRDNLIVLGGSRRKSNSSCQ